MYKHVCRHVISNFLRSADLDCKASVMHACKQALQSVRALTHLHPPHMHGAHLRTAARTRAHTHAYIHALMRACTYVQMHARMHAVVDGIIRYEHDVIAIDHQKHNTGDTRDLADGPTKRAG